MILILTKDDLDVPYEEILARPLDFSFFKTDNHTLFNADFIVFSYSGFFYVIKNRVDSVTGMMSESEVKYYIDKIIKGN